MKKSIFIIKTLALFLLISVTAQAEIYQVDTPHSSLIFSIQHMGLGNTWGRFNDFSGTIDFDAKNLANSSIKVEAKTASVDTNNKKRDDHLRNADFFDAGTFPSMSFSGKGFKEVSDNNYEVTGSLNIHGEKQDVTVVLKKVGEAIHFSKKKPAVGFEAEFSIERKDFNIGQGKVDGAVGKSVRIIVALEAIAE